MNTTVYYFSGTGNALWVARKISEKLVNTNLVSIPHIMENETVVQGGIIGIVCPVYMHNMPHLVADFIRRIESAEYIFLVFAGAGKLGKGVKEAIKLFQSRDIALSSLFNIPMPSNYTPYGCPSAETQNSLLANVDARIEDIVKTVKAQAEFFDTSDTSFFGTHIHPGFIYRLGYPHIQTMDNGFSADETCNGCSICQKVCPVNNIAMKDNKPFWKNSCQQCFACLQWCPNEAIQYRKQTEGIKRYQNPYITVQDIIASSAGGK